MANDTATLNPYEFSKHVATAKIEQQAANDLLTTLGQQFYEEQTTKPQFVQGTKTAAEILAEKTATAEKEALIAKARAATDWDNLQIAMGQDLAALAYKQRELNTKVMQDSSVSLFDDPLQAIANAFTLPWDKQALDAVTAKIEDTHKAMSAVNDHMQQSAQTAEIVSRKMSAQVLADSAAALESHARQTALTARMNAIKDGTARTKAILELDKDQLHAYMQMKALQASEENRIRQNKLFDLQLQKLNKEKIGEETADYYANLALEREGRDKLTGERMAALKGAAQQYYSALVQKGMKYEVQGAGWNWGDNIKERLTWMQTIGKRAPTDQADLIIQAQYSALTEEAPAGVTDKKQWAAGADARFAAKFADDQHKIGEGSPFAAPAYSTFIDWDKRISEHPIWKKYIQPVAAENPKAPVNMQLIVKAAASAIGDGMRQPEARNFILAVVNTSMELNNSVHEFERITGGLRQQAYGTKLKTGVFGGEKYYNLADPAVIDEVLAKSISGSRMMRPELFQLPMADSKKTFNHLGIYPEGSNGFYPPLLIEKGDKK